MPITVNQGMLDKIAGDDFWSDSDITFSINVDPGNMLQFVLEILGITQFDPVRTPITGNQTAGEVARVLQGFALWDDLIPQHLIFADGDDDADITVNKVTNLPADTGGLTYETLHTPIIPDDADVFLKPGAIVPGTGSFRSMVHEFGHALGLSHPGDYNVGNGPITYENDRSFDEDTGQFSIMSYFDPIKYDNQAIWSRFQILTPMIYDILAIQRLYGTDTTTRTGATTYGFNVTADLVGSVYQFAKQGIAPVLSIWDAGGQDRIDVSGYGADQRIDLHEGTYSDIAGLKQNLGIAVHTAIEDAVTGSGNDTITGNALGNVLSGGGAQDVLTGEEGNDILYGGIGDDRLEGGLDNDSLYGSTGADTLIGGSGLDFVYYASAVGEVVTLSPTGAATSGIWLVNGPAEGAGDVLESIEGFVFGGGNDLITVMRTPTGRGLSVDGDYGNDTIIANGDAKDIYTLIGGYGSDAVRIVGNSVFHAYGGKLVLGTWSESPLDNDSLTINHSTYATAFQFSLQGSAATSTSYTGTDGSSARGFNRLTYFGSKADDRIDGMRGDDLFKGGDGFNRFTGYSGNDTIEGGDGSDEFRGGDGNDLIYGGSGQDYLYGEAGDDAMFAGTGGPGGYNLGMEGNDSLTGSDEAEGLFGGTGDDWLSAEGGADQVYGDGGNDKIFAGAGNDFLYLVGVGRQLADGGTDKDELHVDRKATTQDVTFFLNGKAGNDGTITRGIELLFYASGSGNDSIVGGGLGGAISGGSGNDTLVGTAGYDDLKGDAGNDRLLGGGGLDLLSGGDGDDWIETGTGRDNQVYGQTGNDTLVGSADVEQLYGGTEDDVLRGLGGNDGLNGGGGMDKLYGGDGNDVLQVSGAGKQIVDGGAGIDDLSVDRTTTTQGVSFILNRSGSSDGSLATNIETFQYRSGSGNDTVTGGDLGRNILSGFSGNDKLTGGVAADNITGGDGNDSVYGGAGQDELFGGNGNDLLYTGTGGDYYNTGDAGNDTLIGSADAEALYGGTGQDNLQGLGGYDKLYGGDDNDVLIGGAGNDELWGGLGNDRFVFATTSGSNRIVDFDADAVGGQDRIDVQAFGFASFAAMRAAGTVFVDQINDCTITFGATGVVVTLNGITAANLTAGDFLF